MALAHQDAANSRKFTHASSSSSNLPGDYSDSDDDSFLELVHIRNPKRRSAATKKRLEHERRLAEATVVPPPVLNEEYTSQSLMAIPSSECHALENHHHNVVDIEADAWPPPPVFASNAHEATHHAACRSVPPPPNLCAAIVNGDGLPVSRIVFILQRFCFD